jgi:hypothetical protein
MAGKMLSIPNHERKSARKPVRSGAKKTRNQTKRDWETRLVESYCPAAGPESALTIAATHESTLEQKHIHFAGICRRKKSPQPGA